MMKNIVGKYNYNTIKNLTMNYISIPIIAKDTKKKGLNKINNKTMYYPKISNR